MKWIEGKSESEGVDFVESLKGFRVEGWIFLENGGGTLEVGASHGDGAGGFERVVVDRVAEFTGEAEQEEVEPDTLRMRGSRHGDWDLG